MRRIFGSRDNTGANISTVRATLVTAGIPTAADPSSYLFHALNHHTDEISCAIGVASLGRLGQTIMRRLSFVSNVAAGLAENAKICQGYPVSPTDSPFVYPIIVDVERISCNKIEFAEAIQKEGIDLNPHYRFVVDEWPWVQPYLADGFKTENARSIRDRSFNLYLNETTARRKPTIQSRRSSKWSAGSASRTEGPRAAGSGAGPDRHRQK